ncbi:MAG: glycosyltransferase family 2 protein [Euryarchaeota archaeon]|nr:glycosyltransferase family 2 protein [Euryarchaeota archaeon]
MKLVVIIPALNEEKSIAGVIREIPRDMAEGVDVVVVDDGSDDRTSSVAREAGADEVVRFNAHRGLAQAFMAGLNAALERGADVIVNIDADGQYVGGEIPRLVEPIRRGEADVVLGSRFGGTIEDMPLGKRLGNRLATRITRWVSGVPVTDAQTGFRAFSRPAALRLNVLSSYTYVQETIIQARQKGLKIVEVPCTFRAREGKSRLISSLGKYALRAGSTILRTYLYYRPLKAFLYLGGAFLLGGFLVGLRVLQVFFASGTVTGVVPTALLSGFLVLLGSQIVVLGLVADVVHRNSQLQEEILLRLKQK